MSSPAARRVVVGVGLAVAFGIGISIIMAPAMQGAKNQAALNAPSAAVSNDQTAVNPPAVDSAASARDASTAPVAPPAVATPGPQPSNPPLAANSAAASQGVLNGTDNSGTASNDTNIPKPRHESRRGAQSAAGVKKSSASLNDATGTSTPSSPPPPPAAPNDAVASPDATPAPGAPAPDEANANAAEMDGRITAQVRSSIASLAPGSNIDVKAMSGIVALAGSVPSQDVVEQARQAAQQVPGVRQVDTSALLVANR